MAKIALSRRKKRLTLALVTILMLTGAGVAFAFLDLDWQRGGVGRDQDRTAFTIDSETAVGTILPGGPGQTVVFTVHNPGPGTQSLTLVTVELANPRRGRVGPACWVPPRRLHRHCERLLLPTARWRLVQACLAPGRGWSWPIPVSTRMPARTRQSRCTSQRPDVEATDFPGVLPSAASQGIRRSPTPARA